MLLLVKANDDLVSWCECEHAIAVPAGQLDCPWCGCGWLFSCLHCRKAFTFGVAREVDESIEEIAVRDLRARYGGEPEPKDVTEWIE